MMDLVNTLQTLASVIAIASVLAGILAVLIR